LVFPVGAFGGLKASYRLINRGLLAGIQALGASVELAPSTGPALAPDAGPCFRQPAEGEVTAVGRKLIGSAQVRIGGAILQHGSIILDGDQAFLGRIRADTGDVQAPATLKTLLGFEPEVGVLKEKLQLGLSAVLGGTWQGDQFRNDEKSAAEELEGHYLDPDWTWRI
jgi:lipoate-protein ligase A